MKKGLLLFLAGLMAFYGVTVKAMADARIDSMSSDVREIEDLDLIWLYPNKVLEYKNTADFRVIPGGGAEWGGLIKDMSDMGLGTLGVYIGRPNALATASAANFGAGVLPLLVNRYWGGVAPGVAGPALNPATHNLDLLWGSDIGGADLGIRLGYANALGVGGTTNGETQEWNLQGGLGFANVGSFSQGNIYAEYDSLGGYTAGGYSDIKAGTLWESALSTDNAMRLSGDLELDSDPANVSALAFLLGASCNHKVGDGKALVTSGLFLDYASQSLGGGVNNTSWSWLWNGSVEAQAYDWLTVRAGISHALYNRTNITNQANNGDNFSAGFTVNWQNWAVDTRVTTASLEAALSPNPGNGIFYGGPIVAVSEADIRYKF